MRLLSAILWKRPNLPGAACIGRFELFDELTGRHPDRAAAKRERVQAAVGVCRGCPARPACPASAVAPTRGNEDPDRRIGNWSAAGFRKITGSDLENHRSTDKFSGSARAQVDHRGNPSSSAASFGGVGSIRDIAGGTAPLFCLFSQVEHAALHLRAERKSSQTVKSYTVGVQQFLRRADRCRPGLSPIWFNPSSREVFSDLTRMGITFRFDRRRPVACSMMIRLLSVICS